MSHTLKGLPESGSTSLAGARAGEFDVLVCYDTSRFARNTRDALNFEAAFAAAGVRIYYVVERYWADDEDLALPKEIQHANKRRLLTQTAPADS